MSCQHQGLISLDAALASYQYIQLLDSVSLEFFNEHQYVLSENVFSAVALPFLPKVQWTVIPYVMLILP